MKVLEWKRTGEPSYSRQAEQGDTVELEENTDYSVRLFDQLSKTEWLTVESLGAHLITETVFTVRFDNFVGSFRLKGVLFAVTSWKLGDLGVSGLLAETIELSRDLLYSWNSPLAFDSKRSEQSPSRVPFHDFVFLRNSMLRSEPGQRLQDFIHLIANNPTRRVAASRSTEPIPKVKSVDRNSWVSMATHPERLGVVPFGSHQENNRLASIVGRAHKTFTRPVMPMHVDSPKKERSFDTPENRFLQQVLRLCRGINGMFLNHRRLNSALQHDALQVAQEIERLSRLPFLSRIGNRTLPVQPSQQIRKLPGYRDVFAFYRRLLGSSRMPDSKEETDTFLDGRDVATLYEYNVFLHTVRTISVILEEPPSIIRLERNRLSALIPLGTAVSFDNGLTITYNKSFKGSDSLESYSLPMRPDIVIEKGALRLVLDAKYRVTSKARSGVYDSSQVSWQADAVREMHAYRDAINMVDAALIVYPGETFTFLDVTGHRIHSASAIKFVRGVGAIPYMPARRSSLVALRDFLTCALR